MEDFRKYNLEKLHILIKKMEYDVPKLEQEKRNKNHLINEKIDHLHNISFIIFAVIIFSGLIYSTHLLFTLGMIEFILSLGITSGIVLINQKITNKIYERILSNSNILEYSKQIQKEIDIIHDEYGIRKAIEKYFNQETLQTYDKIALTNLIKDEKLNLDQETILFAQKIMDSITEKSKKQATVIKHIYDLQQTQNYEQLLDDLEKTICSHRLSYVRK